MRRFGLPFYFLFGVLAVFLMFRGDFVFAAVYVIFLLLSGFMGDSISVSSRDGLVRLKRGGLRVELRRIDEIVVKKSFLFGNYLKIRGDMVLKRGRVERFLKFYEIRESKAALEKIRNEILSAQSNNGAG